MSSDNVLHEVSVYLKGDNLVPEVLTARLGIEPSRSHKRGDKSTTPTGKEIVKQTGLWKFGIHTKSPIDLPSLLESIGTKLLLREVVLADLPGVEEAYIDIFIAKGANEGGGGTCEFHLNRASLNALGKLDLPVQFTVAITGE